MTDWADPTLDPFPEPDGEAIPAPGNDPDAPPGEHGPAPDPAWGVGPGYNPAQQQVVDLLGVPAGEPQQFDASLRHDLRHELEVGLEPLLEVIGATDQLFISKYPLAQVHGCEAKFVADRDEPFAWSAPAARGTVAHKAVELSVHWPHEPTPLELVDEAMARLGQGSNSLADYLRTASTADLAELRGEANERVAKFLECFPPIKPQWRPVTESAAKVELFGQRVVLQGKVDLTLGQTRGTTARKVLIDLKSGGFSPSHVDDLRFYALLETIRIGTPPRLVATYYLDTGRPFPETVTEGVLDAALQRTIDGATRMAELAHADRKPVLRPGPSCRWCPLLATCDTGRAWTERRDDEPAPYDPD